MNAPIMPVDALRAGRTANSDPVRDPADGTDDHKENIRHDINDRILGCLIGGAAGDALGYSVEFSSYASIITKYGEDGITAYSVDPVSSKALISDDTQMTLFTAEGLLNQGGDTVENIYKSYKNWLTTQFTGFEDRPRGTGSALMERPELYSRRAPGNTCVDSLSSGMMGSVSYPINRSKGCGGVMRVSSIAFLKENGLFEADKLAARAAAITHGHALGYLPAALLVHIIHKIIYENVGDRLLPELIDESVGEFGEHFAEAPCMSDLISIVSKAITLSANDRADVDNINELGQGWVAEETLAIAIYCALRHQNDFSSGIVAAVNHDGDSDSTGEVAGSILGAYLGA
ncbi:MAG: ADP-ribosylglycohydrolase family protein, partial [Clostridia bacterium]|nr:ADP-ribosylglycohydrolase family protein [Clostridia bacterium]